MNETDLCLSRIYTGLYSTGVGYFWLNSVIVWLNSVVLWLNSVMLWFIRDSYG